MSQIDSSASLAPVQRSIKVAVPIEQAFNIFTRDMGQWWNPANTFSSENFETVIVEPKVGGRWYERSKSGEELDWGHVEVWEPPHQVVLTWQITAQGTPEPNPAKASTVDVRFTVEAPKATRVDLEHRDFDHHGAEAGAIWHQGMASDETGWSFFLRLYQVIVASKAKTEAKNERQA